MQYVQYALDLRYMLELKDSTFSRSGNAATETSNVNFPFPVKTVYRLHTNPLEPPSDNNHGGNSNSAVRALSAPTSKRREGDREGKER